MRRSIATTAAPALRSQSRASIPVEPTWRRLVVGLTDAGALTMVISTSRGSGAHARLPPLHMQYTRQEPSVSTLPVSVVVRSYLRPAALFELVERLAAQTHPTFEVVILEQSGDSALLAGLSSRLDSRFRVVTSPPRDPPAARNEAVRHARGEVLLFIDDDDLPIGRDWIGLHARNYRDPCCMGVVGRTNRHPLGRTVPRFPRLLRAMAMRHTFFKDTVALAHNTLPKRDVDFLVGTNASVRRSLVERIGGWDEGIPMHEEQSFAFKFQRQRRRGERFVFDPGPTIQRRTDVPGGLSRRSRADWYRWELEARLFYYEHVVGHYFPTRYRLLRPLFVVRGIEQTLLWIWDGDNAHRSREERIRATVDLIVSLPHTLGSRRFCGENVRRVPRLAVNGGAPSTPAHLAGAQNIADDDVTASLMPALFVPAVPATTGRSKH